jgi:electron transfer flavoprotein alpha/beta subunit
LTAADLGLAAQTGPAGARQQIVAVDAAEARQAGEKVVDEGDGASRVVAFLDQLKVI